MRITLEVELIGPGVVMSRDAGLLLEVAPHPPTYTSPNAASLQGAPSRAPGRVSGGAGGPWSPISSATSELCDLGRVQPHCLHFRMVTGVQLSWKLTG